jgi:DNA-binding NarL/FixJ family response regulator
MSETGRRMSSIVLVEDHEIMRTGLRLLLERSGKFRITGEASTADDALNLVAVSQPDLVLLGLEHGQSNSLDLIPLIHERGKDTKVLILTEVSDNSVHQQALRLGALGIILKSERTTTLLTAVDKVTRGEVWVNRSVMANLLTEMRMIRKNSESDDMRGVSSLTERERQVIQVLAEGLKNKAIADRLCISEITVKHHLTTIFAKLDVSDRLELLIYAYRHGLANLAMESSY